MATMSLIDVCNYIYPGQVAAGNIMFGMNSDGSFFITVWTVPNIPQPTIEYLQSQIPIYQKQFDIDYFNTQDMILLRQYIGQVPTQRRYISELDCTSYVSSTNTQWQQEANTFIAWRDAVFIYTLQQIALMQSGERTVPTFDEFQTELPVIIWP